MRRNMVVAVVIFLLALLASSVAWAHRSHHGPPGHGFSHHGQRHHGHHRNHGHFHSRGRVEIIIGAPLPGAWHYRTQPHYYAQSQHYVYAYPPVIAVPSSPLVYIERGEQDGIQQPPPYWYYCDNPHGYYPYVRVCPRGWQQVPAQPSPSP